LDAATLIAEKWEKAISTSILHCWVKSTILPVPMSASLAASHGEYRNCFSNVEYEVDEVLALMRGTSLGQEMIRGTSEGDAREAVRSWLDAEDAGEAIVDTANMITMSSDDWSGDEGDE